MIQLRTLLLIDPRPDLLARCRDDFADHDFDLLVTRDLEQALAVCENRKVDLALIDSSLGQEVADRLFKLFELTCAFLGTSARNLRAPFFQRTEPFLLEALIGFLNGLVPSIPETVEG